MTNRRIEEIPFVTGDDLVLVVNLSSVDNFEGNIGGGVIHTHQAVAESNHKEEARNDDENDDDHNGHGVCGQDGLRAERTNHTETSLTGNDGRHDLGYPRETEETHQVVAHDELEHRSKSVTENENEVANTTLTLCVTYLRSGA